MAKRMVIIDGKSVFYRGYYAMPNLSTADGTPTGGVYGFAALALELFKKLKPDYVCVAWDKPKTNIRKRLEIYPEYKAGRKPAPADFYAQIPILHELLAAFGWPLYELDDYEADDIMATLAKKASDQGVEVCLITSDLDALQAINPLVHVYALKKGLTNIERFDPETFTEKYGIRVDQFLDLKALKGDSSDNIPGVPGVGEKTAVGLLQQFDTLENVYENLWQVKDSVAKKLEIGKDSAMVSKRVAELWFDAPVALDLEAMNVHDLDTEALKALLQRLEFRSLLRSLPEHMRTGSSSVVVPDLASVEVSEDVSGAGARAMLMMAKELVVYVDGDTVWLSHEKGKAAALPLTDAAQIVEHVPIIAHDSKLFLKQLLRVGVTVLPEVHHDTAQGSFLLNPLRKSRELADLIGAESVEDPKLGVSAIWALYEEQSAALDALPKLAHLARMIDFPLITVLARMEHRGIKLDVEYMNTFANELGEEISQLEKQMYELAGFEFNLNSPAQVSEAFFDRMGLPTTGLKRTKTGFYSTDVKTLTALETFEIVQVFMKYREYSKLKSTYADAIPPLVDEHNRVHTTFNQDTAATGRLSSDNPNLQQIPVRTNLGRRIKQAFVPEQGNVFVSADYSQFELRLAAVLAGEEKMINDFNAGTDIHAKTASEVYRIPLDNVTYDMRRAAKVINFGVLYGMSQHGLAAAAGMSFIEAKNFIDEYFRIRPKIRQYIDATIKKAHDDGYVETLFGRRRQTPDVKSSNFVVRSSAERAAANMPIQGTEADLMKMAMLEVDKKLEGRGEQLLQIHDSILIECPKEHAEAISDMLVDIMENIYPELGVNLQVDVHTGKNWGEV
jgi:DNA polymerase-1